MFHDLTIAEVRPETDNAVAISFHVPSDLAEAFRFRPGQYLTLRAEVDGADQRRSYSIASLPGQRLTVGVKHVPEGAFSSFCQGLKPGDRIAVMPPKGRFTPRGEHRLLLIAAGSGITPMMSIAAAALNDGAEVTLVYGNRDSGSIMFRDALDALKDRFMDRFTLVHVLSQEAQDVALLHGRVTGDRVLRLGAAGVFDPERMDGVYLCGPGDMIDDVAQALAAEGVPEDCIHFERFFQPGEVQRPPRSAAAKAAAEAGVEVEVILDGARRAFTIGADDPSVIDAAARQGLELPFSCKGGMCCTCRCRVTEGSAEMALNYSLEPWELEAGYTLACQARPTSERLVLDFDAA